MRRIAIFSLLLLILSVAMPQLFAQNDSTMTGASGGVLQIVDTEPLRGQELELDDAITIYFDRAINCATLQEAFRVGPRIDGTLDCDGTSITFTPATAYERAATYAITLSTALRGADGAQLFDAFTLELDTVGFLSVSETFPAPNTEFIDEDTSITVIFNRPVVPLVIFEERDALPQPLTLEPAVEGRGEWVNTSIYIFDPAQPLAGGTTYTVNVDPALTATDGAVFAEPYRFKFSTSPPEITGFTPDSGIDDAPADQPIQVTFNQPMDRASVEAGFRLQAVDAELRLGSPVDGRFEWNEDNTGFMFTPIEMLALDTQYDARFDPLPVAQNGGAALADFDGWFFRTVPFPAVLRSFPQNGEEDVSVYRGSVSIQFASLMDRDSIEERITIQPEPPFEPRFGYFSYSDEFTISFQPLPDTRYTVTLAAGAEDVYGNAIDEPFAFSFTTGDFQAEMNLLVPGGVGFYNAAQDPTQVFITYRNATTFTLDLYDVSLGEFVEYASNDSNYFFDLDSRFVEPANLLQTLTFDGTIIPENALRYDLISFSENQQGAGAICGGGSPSRVNVGDRIALLPETDALNARLSPSTDAAIIEILVGDYALDVLDKQCGSGGLTWLQVTLEDGDTAWIAESVADEYFVESIVRATQAQVGISNAQGGALAPGLYYLKPEHSFRNSDRGHLMIVGTANVVLKQSVDSIMAWVVDVETGEPLPDQPITIYGVGDKVLAQGRTDAEGIFTAATPRAENLFQRRMAVVQSDTAFGIGLSEWRDGIQAYQFGQNFDFYPDNARVYVYTDRPVYRPGQPVYFRGIARARDDMSYPLPAEASIFVEITNQRGDLVYDQSLPLTEYGTFSGQLDLADDALLSEYTIRATLDIENDDFFDSDSGSVRFQVAEYRTPEFQVEVSTPQSDYVQGDTITATVDSTYFFGGAVSDATVEYNVIAEDYFFRYEGQGRFDFTDYNYDSGPSSFFATSTRGTIASGSGRTDSQGEYDITIPAEIGDVSQSQTLTIEATVRDESGQTIAGRGEVVVHQGEVYVGGRAQSYVNRIGEEAPFDIISVDWESDPVANQSVEVEVVERRWSSVQERDAFGRTVWTYEVEEIPVSSGQVTTNADGEATYSFVPEQGGVYKMYLTATDDFGNRVQSSTYTWVTSSQYVSWRQQNSNRIDLIADAEQYSVGDTAEILLTSPFQGQARALVTVERGDVLTTDTIVMDSNSYVYELPITREMSPNIYVSVMIVKGVDEFNPVAAFRIGYVQLGVDIDQREILMSIEADTDQTQPQDTVQYTIRATDYAGTPVQAEIGVGVTDLAVLSLAPMNSRPLLSYFYSETGLSVLTSTVLTINTDQITQEVLDTVKGGGGGVNAEGIIEIRGEFIDTPYWNPTLVTDANGEATFSVRFPDNLTTWRLDARALTLAEDGDLLVGQETFDLLSTKPVLIRPVTPRFFVVDDRVTLAAVVNNNTDEPQTALVAINAQNVVLESPVTQEVTIPPRGRVRVEWEAIIPDVESVQLSFTADAGQFTDGAISGVSMDDEGTLPVYRYEAPETVGTAGTLRTEDSHVENILLPRRFEVTQGRLTVEVDHSLAATTIDGLEYLQNFPHQCTEQTVSRFLPNIMTIRALSDLQVSDPALEDALVDNVNFGVQRLIADQHFDGGWGWFVQSRSNITVTAYALIGLAEAQNQGLATIPEVIENAQGYLLRNLIAMDENTQFYVANRQAFALYALARSGVFEAQRAAALFDTRDNLSLYGKALLADTFYMLDPTATARTDALVNELLNEAIVSAAGVHWEETVPDFWNWNTDTRTTALILSTLTKLRPNSDLLPNIVRYLMIQRDADSWETTQETAWAVMALTDYMVTSGELQPNYDYSVTLNEDLILDGTATRENVRERGVIEADVSELLTDEANRLVFSRTGSNEGSLYYTAYLEAYLPVPEIEALDNGISVQRIYTRPDDPEQRPVTEARVGELLQARLIIVVPDSKHYVVVTDPLPAGVEGINPDLATSAQVGTRPGLDNENPLRRGWGWWYFSNIEFRDEAVRLYADFLPAGTYEYVYTVRPSVPGTYNVIPTTAEEFYFPAVYGRGSGMSFTVLPAND